ncbi:MAG TPA: tetratricopeptide repeat protein [Candidatus Binataceae bacterium]|nr:tetratricopeptide repeat protein [Candidatus Binataceae bacterium]
MAAIWLVMLAVYRPADAGAGAALCAAPAAHTDSSGARDARLGARSRPLTLLAFSEVTLPPEANPSPAVPAGAAPSPGNVASPAASGDTTGPDADWESVPNGAAEAAPNTGAASAAPYLTPDSGAYAPESGAVSPANSPPPALDVSNMTAASLDPSQVPLTDEIKHADNPALAASLRQTELAREELAHGKLDEALRSLGPAVSIDPGNPFAYFYLGRTYAQRQNFAQALTFFKRAEIGFASNPEWLGATLGNEGICYEEMDQMSDAAAAYRRALAAAPDNLMARAGSVRLGEEFPDTNTANPATQPEAVNGSTSDDMETAPPPEEAQPPPPPDAPPVEELPASTQPSTNSSD